MRDAIRLVESCNIVLNISLKTLTRKLGWPELPTRYGAGRLASLGSTWCSCRLTLPELTELQKLTCHGLNLMGLASTEPKSLEPAAVEERTELDDLAALDVLMTHGGLTTLDEMLMLIEMLPLDEMSTPDEEAGVAVLEGSSTLLGPALILPD